MNDDRDPLWVLADQATSPERAALAVEELRRAGLTDPEGIARGFGWQFGEEAK